jgi:hypothetical protein
MYIISMLRDLQAAAQPHLSECAHLLVHEAAACVSPAVAAPADRAGPMTIIPQLQTTRQTSLHATANNSRSSQPLMALLVGQATSLMG